MDVFTLEQNDDIASYTNGDIISGIKEKLWVERYLEPGEFKFVGQPRTGLRSALPLGALVSHTNTKTVMMVENHEIEEDKDKDAVLTITGRSLDSFMEQRVATDDGLGFHGPGGDSDIDTPLYDGSPWPYIIQEAFPWEQVVTMIQLQLEDNPDRSSFEIPYFHVKHDVDGTKADHDPITDGDWVKEDREIERGYLAGAVRDVLEEFDGGIRIERPVQNEHLKIQLIVHIGENKSDTVQFNADAGDLESAKYFWSHRDYKNAAYVVASYWGTYVAKSGFTDFNRRVAWVNANDIKINPADDGAFAWITALKVEKMLNRRGQRAIRRRHQKHLVEATISRYAIPVYRTDYIVGDIVRVNGNYDISNNMRVTEFTEIEDETGEYGFPTLEVKVSS